MRDLQEEKYIIGHHRTYSLLLLIFLAGTLTLILQKWVGSVTIYEESLAEDKMVLHEAILHNQLPDGYATWNELGANGTNIRVATVYFAEAIHRVTNLDVLSIYKCLDTAALFASFLLLFVYLRKTSPSSYAIMGVFYFAAILPLTYSFAYFHPWDRVSLVCWIILLMLLRSERLVWFTCLLAFTITIKYDVILLPGLYLLANTTREKRSSVVLRTAIMFAVAFGVWLSLVFFIHDGFEARNILGQVHSNLIQMKSNWLFYPPALGLLLPVILAFIGFRNSDSFSRASVIFGILLLIPLFLATNFIEIRAELPVLLLMFPSAMIALHRLCDAR